MCKFLRIAQIGFFSVNVATNLIKGLLLAFAIHRWIRFSNVTNFTHFMNKLQKLEDALVKHMLTVADLADMGEMGFQR